MHDLYLFAQGDRDYRAALRDYMLIGGRIPMLPKYAMGIFWSRWFDISANDMAKIVEDYETCVHAEPRRCALRA